MGLVLRADEAQLFVSVTCCFLGPPSPAWTRQNTPIPLHFLALAGVAGLRQNLCSASAARMARSLGIGGAGGLGSIVYALTLLAKFTDNEALLRDAHVAAQLFSDDLIAADKSLDIIGGSAGAILGLLGLYRATKANDVLERATSAANTCLRSAASDRRGTAAGADRDRDRGRSTACRTARQALPIPSLPSQPRPGAKISPLRPSSGSPSKMPAMTQYAATGPTFAMAPRYSGHVSGAMEPPASVSRALPR